MHRNLWIVKLHEVLHRLGEGPFVGHQEVFDIIIGTSKTAMHQMRAPHHAIEQSWQQSGGSESQNLHDVWVSEEEAIQTIVVLQSICTDGQEIFNHRLGSSPRPTINGPQQGRDGLRSHRDGQDPLIAGTTRCAFQGGGEEFLTILVDGFHDNRGAFLDGPHQHS